MNFGKEIQNNLNKLSQALINLFSEYKLLKINNHKTKLPFNQENYIQQYIQNMVHSLINSLQTNKLLQKQIKMKKKQGYEKIQIKPMVMQVQHHHNYHKYYINQETNKIERNCKQETKVQKHKILKNTLKSRKVYRKFSSEYKLSIIDTFEKQGIYAMQQKFPQMAHTYLEKIINTKRIQKEKKLTTQILLMQQNGHVFNKQSLQKFINKTPCYIHVFKNSSFHRFLTFAKKHKLEIIENKRTNDIHIKRIENQQIQ